MSTLYLHIGTPKTGTTAIQLFLHKNKRALEEKDCKFPIFKRNFDGVRLQRNGHFLCSSVTDSDFIESCFKKIFTFSEKYSKIILTDEELWNMGGNRESFWVNLKERLDKVGINLKVLVYLRRQDTYIASHWAQKVKGVKGKIYDFHTFLDTSTNNYDYYSYLNRVANIIGKENIIVRPYEFEQFKDNSIIADFMNAVQIEYDDTFVYDSIIRNVSIGGNVLEVKRYLNMVPEFAAYGPKLRIYLEEVQTQLQKNGKYRDCSTFLKGERVEFMKKYYYGNRNVAKEFLHRDDGILFKSPVTEKDPKKYNYSLRELNMIMDMLRELVKKDPLSPIPYNEFMKISNEASKFIYKSKSKKVKIKGALNKVFKF